MSTMKHSKAFSSLRTFWSFWFLLLILSNKVQSQEPNVTPSAAGLLCISDCATCPVICSSPPSPLDFKPPPSSPPPPPRPLVLQPSPPESHCSDASPPPSPSNILPVGATTTPPPPSSNYSNISATQAPPAKGQKNYTYPYYDFYVISQGDSLQLHSSILFLFFLVFFHSCW